MPLEYWPHACSTAIYLINRLPTTTLNNDSPYFKLFGIQRNYSKLKCFGCLYYPWLKPYSNHKLDPKSKPCIFIGYSPTQSAYYCLELESHRIYTSRHVHFIESDFPFMHHKEAVSMSDALINAWAPIPLTILPQPSSSQPTVYTQIPLATSNQSEPNTLVSSPLNNNIPPSHQMTTKLKQGITKPIKKLNLNVELCHTDLPKNITQALKRPVWRHAMDNEMQALTKNQTWTLVPSSLSQNLVGCKWIFRIKKDQHGAITQHKARLVAHGFHQQEGIDYGDTFSPVVKPATLD